jgi:hypothetical protein
VAFLTVRAPPTVVFTMLMDIVAQTTHKRRLHLFLYLDDSLTSRGEDPRK